MPDATLPGPGHNEPPPYDRAAFEELEAKVNEFIEAAGDWADLGQIENEENAQGLADFLKGLRGNRDKVDDARKAAKKPHDDAAKAVQAAFTPIIHRIDLTGGKLKPMLGAWLDRKEREKAKAAAEARQEAERQRQAAEEAQRKAEARNDFAGQAEAEEAKRRAAEDAKAAERMAKEKARVSSASGGGRAISMRTTWKATITNPRVAALRYIDHPKMTELLTSLAEAEARSKDFDPEKDKIPGIDLNPDRKPV